MGSLKYFTFFWEGRNRVFSTGGNGGVSTTLAKNSLIPSPPGKFPPLKVHSPHTNNFHVITQYNLHYQLQSFLLYHFYFTSILLVHTTSHANFDFNQCLIYLQNVVFSFEKGSSGQNHSLPDSHHPVQKSPRQISHPLHPLPLLGKPWAKDQVC